MDEKAKQASSFEIDQEILDERGINMTVEEVAGLSTVRYSERVKSLQLDPDNLAFLKGLRRRIKNRLASQNSRKRSMEHLRRLSRELRAVRACRADALAERAVLVGQRARLLEKCRRLKLFVEQVLKERSDTTEVPSISVSVINPIIESQPDEPKKVQTKKAVKVTKTPQRLTGDTLDFECCIDRLVEQSVNHIFKEDVASKKKVTAKTVFISNSDSSNLEGGFKEGFSEGQNGVLNLSVKNGRRSHGRKQAAPKRVVAVFCDNEDTVLDLTKENQ